MPKKIPLTQMRQWLESYEGGKSEATISKAAHCDVRTVKRGIEQARRERHANTARAELLTRALQTHHESLLSVLREVLTSMVVPAHNLELRIEQDALPPPIPLPGGIARYVAGQGWIIGLHVEERPEWGLLQEHLKRDAMWKALNQWKKAVEEHLDARLALKGHAAALLEEETRLKVIEHTDKAPEDGFIWPIAVDLFYQVSLNLALGIPDKTNPEKRIVATSDGHVEHGQGGSRLAKAPPGMQEECKDSVIMAFKELKESREANNVTDTYERAKEFTTKARTYVEEISLLGFAPGQCRVCKRLGM